MANILRFRFQQETDPAETAEQLAQQMLPVARYAELHILNGPYLMEEWDPDVIQVTHFMTKFLHDRRERELVTVKDSRWIGG